MKKSWAIVSISILAICACASVGLLAYVVISTSMPVTASTDFQPTPIISVSLPTFAPPPTLTPTPTLAPPALVDEKCLTSLDYVNKVTVILAGWDETAPEFAALMDKAGADPNIVSDPSWQNHVEIDLAKFDKVATQLEALKAPHGLQKVDIQIKAASSEVHSFARDMRDGIHNLDATAVNNSVTHLKNFNKYMDKATQEIKVAPQDDTCG
jgi:hypothetical protein